MGVEEFERPVEGWSVERTNSGESIFCRCERKMGFHGAGLDGVLVVVVDIARRRALRRRDVV